MRRDVYYYFQRALHRQLPREFSPKRFLSDDEMHAGFVVRMTPGEMIEAVEYRCTTCVTLLAICQHIAEEWQGATLARARSLRVEDILEQHPEIPASRHSRAHLAAAAAQAALQNLNI